MIKKLMDARIFGVALSAVAMVALWMTTLNMNSACMFVAHQPELPEEAKHLRKF